MRKYVWEVKFKIAALGLFTPGAIRFQIGNYIKFNPGAGHSTSTVTVPSKY